MSARAFSGDPPPGWMVGYQAGVEDARRERASVMEKVAREAVLAAATVMGREFQASTIRAIVASAVAKGLPNPQDGVGS